MKKLMLLALLSSNLVLADSLESSIQPIADTSQFTMFLSNEAKMDTILEEVKCENYLENSGKRKKIVREIKNPMNINIGMLHVGQTIEGDVISFEKIDGKNMYTLYFCERPMVDKKLDIEIMYAPFLSVDRDCDVAQVTAADLIVPTNFKKNDDGSDKLSPYQLAFYPLAMSEESSLCREREELSEAQAIEVHRNLLKEGFLQDLKSNDSDALQVSSGAVKAD
jgi:hypothetical protein